MNELSTDQYVSVGNGCPISTDIDRVGELVQVNIGSVFGRGNTVRLLMSDADTCHRLAEAFIEARNKLVASVYEGVSGVTVECAPAERVAPRQLAGVGESRS